MPELKVWLAKNDYPFEFTTEASVNLADDDDFLRAMSEANFVGVFVGIESPNSDTLVAMKKKQNTRRSLVELIHKIYAAGIFVTAGFIVGFDNENGSIADAMIEFIEEAAIPVCMVGLLYALPNTQLTRRLEKEGRLHTPPLDPRSHTGSADQCTKGLNFDTVRPREQIHLDYKRILEKDLRTASLCGARGASGRIAQQFASEAANACQRFPARIWRFGNAHSDRYQSAGTARCFLAGIQAMCVDQPAIGTLARSAICTLFAFGTVLSIRRQRDRGKNERNGRN